MSGAYYNEIDPEKAQWIRELIKANVVAPGEVDERDIKLVQPDDLRGYRQCHFFAGIAVWSYALRLAGWPDDREVWTGSCPCPSFSSAGKGEGFDDPRHLWPEWYRLIRECRPGTIFGEQVDAAIRHGWLDLVCGNMEAEEYAIAAAVLGAHSAGAPHIRQRLYFCAHTLRGTGEQFTGSISGAQAEVERERFLNGSVRIGLAGSGEIGDCTHADGRESKDGNLQRGGEQRLLAPRRGTGRTADTQGTRRRVRNADDIGPADGEINPSGDNRETGHGSDSPQRGLAMHRSAPGNAGHPAFTDEAGQRDDTDARGSQIGRPESIAGVGRCADRRAHGSHIGAEIEESGSGVISRDNSIGAGLEGQLRDERIWRGPGWLDPESARSATAAGATRGFWADCDWWYGRDGKYRPIEPGLFPLAHGASNRVLKLRGYGDAINAQVAKAFIESYCG